MVLLLWCRFCCCGGGLVKVVWSVVCVEDGLVDVDYCGIFFDGDFDIVGYVY